MKRHDSSDGLAGQRGGGLYSLGGMVGRGGGGGATTGRRMGQHRAALPKSFPAPHLRNLVLVACHSVYTGLDFRNSEEESSWFLLSYQKVHRLYRWHQGGCPVHSSACARN
jgi:hypothetical protein